MGPEDFERAERYARANGLSQLALAATIRNSPERSDAGGQLRFF